MGMESEIGERVGETLKCRTDFVVIAVTSEEQNVVLHVTGH